MTCSQMERIERSEMLSRSQYFLSIGPFCGSFCKYTVERKMMPAAILFGSNCRHMLVRMLSLMRLTIASYGCSMSRSNETVLSRMRSVLSTASLSLAYSSDVGSSELPLVCGRWRTSWHASSTFCSFCGCSSTLLARKMHACATKKRSCFLNDCLAKKRCKKTCAVAIASRGSLSLFPHSSMKKLVLRRYPFSSAAATPSRRDGDRSRSSGRRIHGFGRVGIIIAERADDEPPSAVAGGGGAYA